MTTQQFVFWLIGYAIGVCSGIAFAVQRWGVG